MFTLETALKALEGREEFAVRRLNGMVIVNYLIQLPDSFEGIRREFRGIVFEEASGQIASLPLHKFFNVNQTPETQIGLIGHEECEIHEKLDGSMCHALFVGGELMLSTRMGWDSDQSRWAQRLLDADPALKDWVAEEVRSGWTPVFEYVGPHNAVVVPYAEERLVYLWSRRRSDGAYRRCAVRGRPAPRERLRDVVDRVLSLKDQEGFVCVLDGGLWVKVKSPWYLERHQVVDLLMRPAYRIYELALEGKIDDVIALAAPAHRPLLTSIQEEVARDQLRRQRELHSEFEMLMRAVPAGGDDRERRKAFAIAAKPHPSFGGLMALYLGRPCEEWINGQLFDEYKAKYPSRLFTMAADEP